MKTPSRRRLALRSISPALIALCVVLAAAAIVHIWHNSAGAVAIGEVRWPFALLAVLVMVCAAVTYAFCWSMVLASITTAPIDRARARRLFLLAWPGRYVPASLPHYGARFAVGPSLGAPRTALAASFVYENVFTIAAAGSLAMVLLLIQARDSLTGSAWTVAAIAAAGVALLALHPAVVRTILRICSRRIHRLGALTGHVLEWPALVRLMAGYALASVCTGLSFWLSLRTLDAHVSIAQAIAVYNLAGIAGMLAVLVPSGVGVREGVVVALLSGVVSPPVALSAAVIARLAGVVADVTPLAAILLFDLYSRIRSRRQIAANEPVILREAA